MSHRPPPSFEGKFWVRMKGLSTTNWESGRLYRGKDSCLLRCDAVWFNRFEWKCSICLLVRTPTMKTEAVLLLLFSYNTVTIWHHIACNDRIISEWRIWIEAERRDAAPRFPRRAWRISRNTVGMVGMFQLDLSSSSGLNCSPEDGGCCVLQVYNTIVCCSRCLLDLRPSRLWLWGVLSSYMWLRVVWYKFIDVSEGRTFSIVSVEE